MNYRYATVLAEKSLSTTTTETIDLNIQDPISRLEITWKPTLTDREMLAALAVGISKIELVDGSDVLHSLSGRQNQALCLYDRRIPTMNDGNLIGGSVAFATFGIDFGRFLYDPELAFVPSKFRNPQLKITHDSTLVGANCSTHYLEILAHCFDERVITPIGFLVAKQHYAYVAAAADAYEYVDLPTDHPIRQLLVRGWHTDVDPTLVVDELKLSEDNDKRIPFDMNLVRYVHRMKAEWQQLAEVFADYAYGDGTSEKYVTPTDEWTSISGLAGAATHATYLNTYTRGGYVQWRNAGNLMTVAVAHGFLPHHTIQVPFGRQDQIDDWYDVTRLGNLRARLLSAANFGSGSEISLVLQQLRRY